MTHDELLDKIQVFLVATELQSIDENFEGTKMLKALRAVVKLANKDIKHESYVWLDGYDFAMKQIIQAIEKELK